MKRPVDELRLSHRLADPKWKLFDEVLDELAPYGEVSIEELGRTDAVELLAPILGVKSKQDGTISRQTYMRALYRPYQSLGMFGSPKDTSLHLYDGIWYTKDNCYLVGSAQSLEDKQPRAHLLRRFHFLKGQSSSEVIRSLLDATSVVFVRLDGYTVFPYYFNLIDIFVDNKLRYISPSSEGT